MGLSLHKQRAQRLIPGFASTVAPGGTRNFAEETFSEIGPPVLVHWHRNDTGDTPTCPQQEKQHVISSRKEGKERGSWPKGRRQINKLLPGKGHTPAQGNI